MHRGIPIHTIRNPTLKFNTQESEKSNTQSIRDFVAPAAGRLFRGRLAREANAPGEKMRGAMKHCATN